MPDRDETQAELLQKFNAPIAGLSPTELRALVGDLAGYGGRIAGRIEIPQRPELRRAPLPDRRLFRVRVDLDGASPPIWRRLDMRSDLTLDVVHQVIQAAFGWTDSHLHRFALGGDPFAATSQVFLCPYDFEEGDYGDDDSPSTSSVRLDETLQKPGDVLSYVYDYGDAWELTLRLEKVLPADPDAPPALVIDGRRAAPPEDSGGIRDAPSLADVLDDPTRFNLDEINEQLADGYFPLGDSGLDHRLIDVLNRLRNSPIGAELVERALLVAAAPAEPVGEFVGSLAAYGWFLDRAANGGIELTSAGYLKPADVEAACQVTPSMSGWIGKNNRESLAPHLLDFRMSLQSLGLLRKYKGTLLLTRTGARVRHEPTLLWDLLAAKAIPPGDGFGAVASVLLLVYGATSEGEPMPLDRVAEALTVLGWRSGQYEVEAFDLYSLPTLVMLSNVGEMRREALGSRREVSQAAAALARAALRRRTH